MTEQTPDLTDPNRAPSRAGVLRAAAKIAKILAPTPLLPLEVDGRTIWCKAECLQPIGSFKIRGAWSRMTELSAEQCALGVVGVSSGNHAQGVAWAAKRLGVSAIIVMPADAPGAKIAATRALGAKTVLYDRMNESRDVIAAAITAETGRTLVHAFGDPWVIEGQGSAGIEAEAQMRNMTGHGIDWIIACCGGGGLASGLALACPDAQVTLVEPEGWDDVTRSLASGAICAVENPPPTACDALQTLATYPINFAVLRARGVNGVTVNEAEVRSAQRAAFERLRLVVEPGGAVALAAVLTGKVETSDATMITLSGGSVDPAAYARVIADSL